MKFVVPFLFAFFLWAVLHSLSASNSFKQFVEQRIGLRLYDGLYRLAYNIFAVVSFLPVLALAAALTPNIILWRVPQPVNMIFVTIQIVGLIGLGISLMQTDLLRFAGLGQAIRYFRGYDEINPAPVLVSRGTYALVRHPLYFFSLVFLWFTPVMTLSTLLFNLLATGYFWVGSIYEEHRLAAHFGDDYRAYKQKVPRLIPIKIRSKLRR